MTMEELKNKIENKIEDLQKEYSYYLKRWDEALSQSDEDYYDSLMNKTIATIKTYEDVLRMMEEK